MSERDNTGDDRTVFLPLKAPTLKMRSAPSPVDATTMGQLAAAPRLDTEVPEDQTLLPSGAAPIVPIPAQIPNEHAPAIGGTQNKFEETPVANVVPNQDETQVLPESAVLQRVAPAGHFDMFTLTEPVLLIGRDPECPIRLLTSSAHRRHARLLDTGAGWAVEPLEGKEVEVNGDRVLGRMAIAHKARLRFGGDELVFIDISRRKPTAPTVVVTTTPQPPSLSVQTLLLALLILFLLVMGWIITTLALPKP